MDKTFSFEKLDVWQESRALVKDVYTLLRRFPNEERYALCDQIRRAVVSVPSNIAEGSGRMSKKEQIHFMEIAYGSLMEVYCQLQLAQDLGFISQNELTMAKNKTWSISRMLVMLRRSYEKQLGTGTAH